MNTISGRQTEQAGEPGHIDVVIEIIRTGSKTMMNIKIDPNIPLNEFLKNVKQQVFFQDLGAQYDETIEFIFIQKQGAPPTHLDQYSSSTLLQLGFENNSIVQVRLKLKGGEGN